MLGQRRVFPDMEKDTVRWNKAWEEEVERFSTFVWAVDAADMLDSYSTGDDEAIAGHRSAIHCLCLQQRNLSVLAFQRFAIDNLEQEWHRLDTSTRQTHLLEGMVRTCRILQPPEERLHCEEITLPYLQKGNGQGFLDLLKEFILPDTTTIPTEPKILSSTRFDRMLRPGPDGPSEKHAFFLADHTLHRNRFICESYHSAPYLFVFHLIEVF